MLCITLLLAPAAFSQFRFPRHTITGDLGAAIPGQDLRGAFEPSFAVGAHYGYRFHRYFEANAGFDTAIQSARIDDYVYTAFGARRIRDYQMFLPFGGRVIVPTPGERWHFFAGGGGVYVRYYEAISQPSRYFRIDCPPCSARSGVGYYGLAGFRWRPSQYSRFWIGASARVVRVETDGDPIGELIVRPTRDRWITPMVEFGFSF